MKSPSATDFGSYFLTLARYDVRVTQCVYTRQISAAITAMGYRCPGIDLVGKVLFENRNKAQ
jgi:hypothetical protein